MAPIPPSTEILWQSNAKGTTLLYTAPQGAVVTEGALYVAYANITGERWPDEICVRAHPSGTSHDNTPDGAIVYKYNLEPGALLKLDALWFSDWDTMYVSSELGYALFNLFGIETLTP